MSNPFESIDKRLTLIEELLIELKHRNTTAAKPDNVPGAAVPIYASKQESARILGCSPGTVDNYRRQGKIKAYKLGKNVKFLRTDILGLAKSYNAQ